MSDAVADSLARYQRHCEGEKVYDDFVVVEKSKYSPTHMGDIALLASNYAAEHPADDETPVDVEWCHNTQEIRQLGCLHNRPWFHVGMLIDLQFDGPSCVLLCKGEKICDNPTRGDVRRLCRALRIDLKEGVA